MNNERKVIFPVWFTRASGLRLEAHTHAAARSRNKQHAACSLIFVTFYDHMKVSAEARCGARTTQLGARSCALFPRYSMTLIAYDGEEFAALTYSSLR